MFNAAGHLGDYFNGFLPNHVLTVNLNTVKLPLSPMLKSSGRQEHSLVKWWTKQMIKGPIQNKKKTQEKKHELIKLLWLRKYPFLYKYSNLSHVDIGKLLLQNSCLILLITGQVLNHSAISVHKIENIIFPLNSKIKLLVFDKVLFIFSFRNNIDFSVCSPK